MNHTNPANLRLNSPFLLPVFDFKTARLWGIFGACLSLSNWILYSMYVLLLSYCMVSRLQRRLLSPAILLFPPFVSPALFSALCCSPSLYVIIRQLRTRTFTLTLCSFIQAQLRTSFLSTKKVKSKSKK